MQIQQPSLSDLLEYRCMFFDFDGVVLESGNIKTEAFLELYQGLGIDEEVKAHHIANQGISRYEKFKWIAGNLLSVPYTDAYEKEMGDKFSSLVKQKVTQAAFVSGFPELIREIRMHDILCVIASGTPQTELENIVKDRGLTSWFDEVHGSPKKKADIVEDVLERYGLDRESCLFYGDASTDHEAAENTNIDFFARLSDELSAYWQGVTYRYGAKDFSGITD